MKGPKLATLQVGRGVAAALVAAYHAIEIVSGNGRGAPFGLFRFGYSGVDFFFVLSGFLIYHIHASDLGSPQRLEAYLYKRFVRVYPVYWVVMAALICAMLLVPSITDSYKRSIGFVLQSLLLIPQELPPLLGVSWSLCYEQAFYLVFGLAILSRRAGLVVAGALAAISCADLFLDVTYPLAFLCNARILEFFLGVGAAIAVKRTSPQRSMRPCLVIGVLIFAAVGMVDAFFYKLPLEGAVIGYGIPSALVIFSAVCAERQTSFKIPRLLELTGAAAYSVYLVHWPAIVVMSRIFGEWQVNPNLTWLIVTGSAIAAGIAFHLCVEKPLLTLLSHKRPTAKQSLQSFVAPTPGVANPY
jgi:exopolysaccharide production protein ExoZ